jgi:hypothetical protein
MLVGSAAEDAPTPAVPSCPTDAAALVTAPVAAAATPKLARS